MRIIEAKLPFTQAIHPQKWKSIHWNRGKPANVWI